jgi:tetratricopeptide (TPR) repeat protein
MSSSSSERLPGDEPASAGRLDSWKEIASYLKRSVRSAKRWEKEEGLPIHRHLHGKRDSVYAYRGELDDWWVSRGAEAADQNGAEGAEDAVPPAETEAPPPRGDSLVEEAARGSETEAKSRPPRAPRRAALIAVGFGLAILVAGVVAWLSRGSSSTEAGKLRPLPFQARDWVLVAGFENRTGEKLFDGTLDYALGLELSNSRHVNVASRERVGDALRLMRKPPDTPIDVSLAREVCLRDGGIRALLTGRVEKLGSRYLLSVELVDPKEGTTLAGFREESSGPDASLAAIRRISDRVRVALGETPPPSGTEQAGLAKVTTSSLKALQLYSRADLLMARDGNQAAAEDLLRQAVAEDPTFASAWNHLAWTLRNQRRPLAEFRSYAETALRLAETTTGRERYFIRASYYSFLGQREKAIPAYEALLSLYPDHPWAVGNLTGGCYDWQHDPRDLEKAVQVEARAADARPRDFGANWDAAFDSVAVKPDPARAAPYLRRVSELITPEIRDRFPDEVSWIDLVPFTDNWLKGDLATARSQIDRIDATIDSLRGLARDCLAVHVVLGNLTLGRLEAALRTSAKIADPEVRAAMVAQIDFLQGRAFTPPSHFPRDYRYSRFASGDWGWTTLVLQARAGFVKRADPENFVDSLYAGEGPAMLRTVRGEIALVHGHLRDAIRDLEEAWRLYGDVYLPPGFYLGGESLATVLETTGDLPRAIQVLERRPEGFYAVSRGTTGAYWLRNRLQLAKLYRRVGRAADAQTVEAELSKLLAVADPDHPILIELRRLQGS